jgi:hypothetical protein
MGLERRRFLAAMAVLGVPVVAPSALRATALRRHVAADFPRNDPERVSAVVGASHGNIDVVRQLVTEQPALAKSAWDWGFGDWETPLGAASHTGRHEIAELLIAHGAQPNVFSAAMMGHVDAVRAFLTVDPTLIRMPGPHGISLLAHASVGGAQAARVLDYLSGLGAEDTAPGFAGDADVEARYGGRYRFEVDPVTEIGVAVRNGSLLVGAGEQPNSRVREVGPDVFHPTGAPAVRLRFEVVDGRARAMTIVDGLLTITGERVTP